MFDYLIVGAGFAGSVLAERLASQCGQAGAARRPADPHRRQRLRPLRRRRHPHPQVRAAHLSHELGATCSSYLSQFTHWRPYEHRVLASVDGQLLPIPINLDTVNRLYGLNLTRTRRSRRFSPRARSRASRCGRRRTWSSARSAASCTRSSSATTPASSGASTRRSWTRRSRRGCRPAPIATTAISTDTYQAMPLHGYTRMFERMLAHPEHQDHAEHRLPRDRRGDSLPRDDLHRAGRRVLRLPLWEAAVPLAGVPTRDARRAQHQPVAVVNYPNDHPYTRVTEFKHLTGPAAPARRAWSTSSRRPRATRTIRCRGRRTPSCTSSTRRWPTTTPGVHFVGRLATYKYYNMDQVVGAGAGAVRSPGGQRPRRGRGGAPDAGRQRSCPCRRTGSRQLGSRCAADRCRQRGHGPARGGYRAQRRCPAPGRCRTERCSPDPGRRRARGDRLGPGGYPRRGDQRR